MIRSVRQLQIAGLMACLGLVGSCADNPTRPDTPSVVPLTVVAEILDHGSNTVQVTRLGEPVMNAIVSLNGSSLAHIGEGRYRGDAAGNEPGAAIAIDVRAAGVRVRGSCVVPEVPVLSGPKSQTVSFPTETDVTLNWTSGRSPDRFVVMATWLAGGENHSTSTTTNGGARSLSLRVTQLPVDIPIELRVLAWRDGMFGTSATLDSRASCRTESTSGVAITRAAGPIHVSANLGPRDQAIFLSRDDRDVADATVVVNDVQIPYSESGLYEGPLLNALHARSPVLLEVNFSGGTAIASGIVPVPPSITGPTTGTGYALNESVTVSWTSGSDPDFFVIQVAGIHIWTAPGSAREMTIPADQVGEISVGTISVRSVSVGSVTGPVDPESSMNVYSDNPEYMPVISIRP